MSKKRDMQRLARGFDGEYPEAADVAERVKADPALAQHYAALEALRSGVKAVAKREVIQDAQFGAFMAGIREGIAAEPERRWGGRWAWASAFAAIILIVACLLVVMAGHPSAVRATDVESATTDLKGATVEVYKSNGGKTATIWVNSTSGDEW